MTHRLVLTAIALALATCAPAVRAQQFQADCPLPFEKIKQPHLIAQSAQEIKDKQPAQKPEAAPLKQPLAFGLEDGTPVKLRLTRNLSSADATTGDRVDFEVLEDTKVKDLIVIPRGGIAWGTITKAQHKGRMARGGKPTENINDVRLAGGGGGPFRAVKKRKGGGQIGAITGGY